MENRRLFVGGLPWSLDSDDLKGLFEDGDEDTGSEGCGSDTVEEAIIIYDRETKKSKGFGFVTMKEAKDVKEAIKKLHGVQFKGRPLKVDEAENQATNRRDGDRRDGGRSPFRSRDNSRGSSTARDSRNSSRDSSRSSSSSRDYSKRNKDY